MLAVRTSGAPQATRTVARPAIPPSPLRDRVGYSDHDRFRGYFPVHFIPAYKPPCLRFAVAVTGHHARLGSPLLARLYRGRHLRRQSSTHLHGATRSDPCERNSRIRLPPWVSDGGALMAAHRMCSSACGTVVRFWARTRGRCGSLLLHRDGLPSSTPCRSPGAHRFTAGSGHDGLA